ncbi:hypothetical protein NE237_020885 [Protea cynaroides]|uniref:Polygalacturonase n=1 Tax=Protea cynaroides TaxID=273540 RepID=A0A9Q0H834_9MAGN|nr:hypothetical protein NE237_020885 [Protea cynaroides]
MIFLVISTAPVSGQSRLLYDQPQYDNHTNVFSLLDYGAVGDGFTDDTQAFQEAWNGVCSSSVPSPVLHVHPDKTFLLHPLVLQGPCKSNNISVEIQGTIVAPSDISEWKCDSDEGTYNCPSWLTFENVNDLYIIGGEGKSTIDGRGQKWWDLSCHKAGCGQLPMMLIVRNSNNVHINHLNIVNSPVMHLIIFSSKWVYIHNINIEAPKRSPNTDGLHISHSQNVFVYDSHIGTGDDCVSIEDQSSNINIDSISCGPGHGISIGGLGGGGNTATVEYIHGLRVIGTEESPLVVELAAQTRWGRQLYHRCDFVDDHDVDSVKKFDRDVYDHERGSG